MNFCTLFNDGFNFPGAQSGEQCGALMRKRFLGNKVFLSYKSRRGGPEPRGLNNGYNNNIEIKTIFYPDF